MSGSSAPVVDRALAAILRRLSVDSFELAEDHDAAYFRHGIEDTARYVDRFEGTLDVRGRSVVDVGCGYGSSCFALVQRGATRVVGIDVSRDFIDFAEAELARSAPALQAAIEFRHVEQEGAQLGERFDVAMSKDSFEHIADPEAYLDVMKRYLRPGGELAIGFGPLWRSPYGAHQKWMSKLPWAHLLFPERVLMDRWQRLGYPDGARTHLEITGGLNRMTLRRFRSILDDPELEPIFLRTNQTHERSGRILRAAAKLPGLRELCTFNVYGLWRYQPAADAVT
ncbi:MAG: class I SAM-dependent methyltransferase [Solirubrobacteraceae bacterium]|nr:class I SAM-dependent methyltransferase [Solirubrobacteraceae bacterium]